MSLYGNIYKHLVSSEICIQIQSALIIIHEWDFDILSA